MLWVCVGSSLRTFTIGGIDRQHAYGVRRIWCLRSSSLVGPLQAEIESHFGQSLDKLHEKFTRPRRMSAAAAAAHAAHAILRRGGSAPHIHDEQLGAIREDENQDVDGTQLNVSTDARVEGLSHDVWNVLLEQVRAP